MFLYHFHLLHIAIHTLLLIFSCVPDNELHTRNLPNN